MTEFKEPSMWKMMWEGRKGGEEFSEYINSLDLEDPDVLDFLRGSARNVMSDRNVAINQGPSFVTNLSLINNALGQIDDYHGQALNLLERSDYDVEQYNKRYGLQESANLRDVFLGWEGIKPEDEGLYETDLRPGGTRNNWDQSRYPFDNSGETVYDIAPFIQIQSIINPTLPKESTDSYTWKDQWGKAQAIKKRAHNLDIGEGFKIEEPLIKGSLDLGQSNWSIGKDEKGIYAAITDVWDFQGGGQAYGEVLDKIGTPINMYGRIYLENYHFHPYDEREW